MLVKICLPLFLSLLLILVSQTYGKTTQDVESVLNDRILNLQIRFNNIEKNINNTFKEIADFQMYNTNSTVEQLKLQYQLLTADLTNLNETVKRLKTRMQNQNLPPIIINDIKGHEVSKAYEKMSKFNVAEWPSAIKRIIHGAYANNIGNFDLVHEFVKHFEDEIMKYAAMLALWREMKLNGHMDAFKLLALYNTCHFNISLYSNITLRYQLKGICDDNYDSIRNAIMASASGFILVNLPPKNYKLSLDIRNLTKALNEFDKQTEYFSDSVMEKIIDDNYDLFSKERVIADFYNLYTQNALEISQIVQMLTHFLSKLESTNQLDIPAAKTAVDRIKELRNLPNYSSSVNDNKQEMVENLLNLIHVKSVNLKLPSLV